MKFHFGIVIFNKMQPPWFFDASNSRTKKWPLGKKHGKQPPKQAWKPYTPTTFKLGKMNWKKFVSKTALENLEPTIPTKTMVRNNPNKAAKEEDEFTKRIVSFTAVAFVPSLLLSVAVFPPSDEAHANIFTSFGSKHVNIKKRYWRHLNTIDFIDEDEMNHSHPYIVHNYCLWLLLHVSFHFSTKRDVSFS